MNSSVHIIGLAAIVVLFTHIFPPYVGSIVFWTIVAIQLGKDTALAWRTIRFSSTTAALGWATGISLVFAIAAAQGWAFEEVVRRDPTVVSIAVLAPAAFMLFDRWLHPETWRLLTARSHRYTFLTILRFGRVPPSASSRFSA